MIDPPGFVLWMTGLSGAGKTTLAVALEEVLKARGMRIERLDGDTVREGLTKDLGFSKEDRDKNIERVTFVAKLLSRNNVGVVASFISPYAAMREHVKQETTNFIETYIDAPLEVVEGRDVKGWYAKARAGLVKNFTGIDDPFEAPETSDLHVRTDQGTQEECLAQIVSYLESRGFIPAEKK